ncbi:hypothetical protein KZX46_17720 [Polymorphobacter sp. PAMC 29334]|uniref:DUF4350 domain-containing protein n=1 Tax=Polymorphobacter sp. PAMC 29334 TaxID=2862331 RepID=UPI001C799F74|nr:DUF4350 domain-containing protein [Polymorphobacter sp. PAMC 29334]QYE34579.1 hypothetical protein KZX46_17720 [Polymorphobacter sp. PAMC 29334]
MTEPAVGAASNPAAGAASGKAAPFNRVVLFVLLSVGVVSAVAFAFLTAYAPALDAAHNRGGHALSRAGTGFSAIVDLATASGTPTRLSHDDRPGDAGLLVLTPEAGTSPAQVDRLVRARDGEPTLIIVPKWETSPIPIRPTWIETHGLVAAPDAPLSTVAPGVGVTTRAARRGERLTAPGIAGVDTFPAPAVLQRLEPAAGLDAIVTAADGSVVLGWQTKHNIFILADPDLLDNAGMRDLAGARIAIALLRDLGAAKDGGLVFDVTLNGFGGGRDLLRLMLEPPFLGLTLALVAVAGLAVWQAAIRFGTPVVPGRAIAFGSAALIDNIAAVIATARREGAIAPRYAALAGATVAAHRHAPTGLTDRERAAWLDRVGTAPRFSVLAHDATLVETPAAALASARALHRWQMEAVHDR